MLLDLKSGSLKNTIFYEEMRNLNKPLLTKDISDIKVLANGALRLKTLIKVRRDFELPRLVKDATDLIHLLETEYNLN
jgi:hypothetical protein